MTPLKDWDKIKRGFYFLKPYPAGFGSLTGKPHLGIDYSVPIGTEVYAPFNGRVEVGTGIQGGKTIHFYWDFKVMRIMHLSEFIKWGRVREGELIGLTGNTGMSSAPHAHIDISLNKVDLNNISNFLDPDELFLTQNNMLNLYGNSLTKEQYVKDNSGTLHRIANVETLNDLDEGGIINKETIVWLEPNEFAVYRIGNVFLSYNDI